MIRQREETIVCPHLERRGSLKAPFTDAEHHYCQDYCQDDGKTYDAQDGIPFRSILGFYRPSQTR